MASFHRLPESFERVIVVGGVSRYGAVVGAAIALSPFLHPHQEVILANALSPCREGEGPHAAASPSGMSAKDAGLVQEAQETLAAITREVIRSRTTICLDGVQPATTPSHVLPFQYLLGKQYPASASEVQALLSRVKIPAAGAGGSPLAHPFRKERDVLLCVLNADVEAAQPHSMRQESVVALIQKAVASPDMGVPPPPPPGEPSTLSGGCVLAVSDERSRHVLAPLVQAVSSSTRGADADGAGVASSAPCFLVVCRARELTPPAIEYGLTKVAVASEGQGSDAAGAFTSMLPALCSGVLLGVLAQIPVYRHNEVPFVPLDVALGCAMCHAIGQMQRLPIAAASQSPLRPPPRARDGSPAQWQSIIAVEPNGPTDTMVWGMFGEYLSDYYGRYAELIRRSFPVKRLLPRSPAALNFTFSPSDSLNYGVDTLDVTRCLEQRAAVAQRRALQTLLPAAWGLPTFLTTLDEAVTRAASHARTRSSSANASGGGGGGTANGTMGLPASLRARIPGLVTVPSGPSRDPPATAAIDNVSLLVQLTAPIATRQGRDRCDRNAYPHLLDSLRANSLSVPLLQYVSLSEMDWNMYICFTARVVLDCLAARATAGAPSPPPSTATKSSDGSSAFPFPTRMFASDLSFTEAYATPAQQSFLRRNMGIADWVCRCGLNANGVRGKMTPGFTSERMSALLARPSIARLIDAAAATPSAAPGGAGSGKDGKTGGASAEDVVKRAKSILARIGDTQNHVQCRTFGVLVYQLFKKVYNRVHLNTGAFQRLRRINALPRTTIVYIPLHRSYSDFLIMSYLLVVMGLRPPHIVAGEDFLRLGKFSELMRGSGAFFMRRTFRGDPLYGALFKEYVAQLVRSGLPLEFFIEGTRSRTGKTMVPKMGILKFITDAFFAQAGGSVVDEGIEDVLFITVSLSYDELMEAKVYANELLGIPKPAESVPNMIKAATQLTHKYGNINVHFGEPISLKCVRENPFECPVPFQPKETPPRPATTPTAIATTTTGSTTTTIGASIVKSRDVLPKTSPTPPHLLTSLAWRITYQLQQNIVITASALVAAAVETLMPLWELETLAASSSNSGSGNKKERSHSGAPAAAAAAVTALPVTRVVAMTAWIAQAVQLRGGNLLSALATKNDISTDWGSIVRDAMGNLGRFIGVEQLELQSAGSGNRNGSPAAAATATATAETGVKFAPPSITSQLGLNISTNQLIHVFVDEALIAATAHAFGESIVEVCAPQSGGTGELVGKSVSMQTLRHTTQFLRQLLSTEFPNFAVFSPCSYDSWLQYAISRLTLGEEEKLALGRCRQVRAAGHKGPLAGGERVVVPACTRLYPFLLQLLLPHVEALYMVAITALACCEAHLDATTACESASNRRQHPALAKHLIIAAHKAAQRLHEQRLIEYVVACNKETVTHYFQSLVAQKMLKTHTVMDLGLAYVPGEAAAAAASASSGGVGSATTTTGGRMRTQRPQLAGLEKLVSDLQALRWHPSTDPQEDVGIAKRTVLTCYHTIHRGAKL